MNLMEQYFKNVVTENHIKLVSNPKYSILKSCDELSNKFLYSVVIETYPIIQLKGLDSFVIKKPIVNVTENDIDLILSMEKTKYTYWECYNNNKRISFGDRVTFSVLAQFNDNTTSFNNDPHNVRNIVMIIGQKHTNNAIYDLEKDIIGRTIGD